jgi:YbgC/YbaW family acyl-CoA thioester hydrolase
MTQDLKLSEFRLLQPLRVRWSEIDAQQIVFNGHYLAYFDVAMSAWWRSLCLPYGATMEPMGLDMFMRACQLDFRAPARLNDLLTVGLKLGRLGGRSVTFDGAVFRGGEVLVAAQITCVFADRQAHRAEPLPAPLVEVMQAHEAGEPMVSLSRGDWREVGDAAGAVRREVFVKEQGIAPDIEWDSHDAQALHVVARNRLGLPVATGRLVDWAHAGEPGVAKIGRMAVLQPLRGSQLGAQVLKELIEAARSRHFERVILHAQSSAAGFYERAGFERLGPEFEEAGLAHVKMHLPLVRAR